MGFDRTWTVFINSGPGAQHVVSLPTLSLPGGDPPLEMEAWTAADSRNTPLVIFEGDISLPQAQDRMNAADGVLDCLCSVPNGSSAKIRLPSGMVDRLTVFWPAGGSSQILPIYLTIRIKEIARNRGV